MNETEKNSTRKSRYIASAALGLICFLSGVAVRHYIVRVRISDAPIFTVRAAEGGRGVMFEGSWPPGRYPTDAFVEIRGEADRILAEIIGSHDASGRYVYVLPASDGYDIIIHEEPGERLLTAKEQEKFRDSIRKRMNEVALQYAPPPNASETNLAE
jgi:hypothetical protein